VEYLSPQQIKSSRLLSPREVAEKTGIPYRKVRELIAALCLPTVQVGKREFVPEAVLKWWLRNGKELARSGYFANCIEASREEEEDWEGVVARQFWKQP
jgi:excisionase family DNA binding protein